MKKSLLIHGIWVAVCAAAWFAGRSSVGEAAPAAGRHAGERKETALRSPVPFTGPPLDAAADALLNSRDYTGKALPDVLRSILTERDEAVREQKFLAMLSKLTAADAMAVQQIFLDNDNIGRWFIPEYNAFLYRWGQVDGAAAAKFTLEHRKTADNSGLVLRLMTGWAGVNPQEAVDWINAHAEAPDWMEKAAMKGLVNGLALKDLDKAAKLVSDHLDSPSGQEVIPTLVDHFVQGPGLAKAAEWFAGVPGDGDRFVAKATAFRAIFDRYRRGGDATLNETAAFVKTHAASPWCDVNACLEVTKSMQAKDPAEAARWVKGLPEGTARIIALKAINGEL